jgi:hypothetical protein
MLCYVLETGIGEVRAGDRDWQGTYWRQGLVRYVRETGIGVVRIGDRAW